MRSEPLRDLLRRLVVLKPFDDPNQYVFPEAEALYAESEGSAREAANYLRIYQAIASELRGVKGDWFAGMLQNRETRDRLIRAVESLPGFDPYLTSSHIVLGKIEALCNRAAAASLLTISDEDLALFQIDVGARTYFSEIRPCEHERPALEVLDHPAAKDVILMSCDPRFLRSFLPYWASVAPYVRDAEFHIIATDPQPIESALAMMRAMAEFRGGAPNVGFSVAIQPSWCINRSTWAACSRFLYARELSELTGARIVILDADFCMTDDPRPWLVKMPRDRIVVNSNMARFGLDPWRKFLGGTFVLPPNTRAYELMRIVEAYILGGLGERHSWFLDQNALTFLMDRVGRGEFVSLATLGVQRPVREIPINRLYERTQFSRHLR